MSGEFKLFSEHGSRQCFEVQGGDGAHVAPGVPSPSLTVMGSVVGGAASAIVVGPMMAWEEAGQASSPSWLTAAASVSMAH